MNETLPLNQSTAEQISPSKYSGWSDWLGLTASIGCAIHCAAMPFVIASLPALGLSFLADESFHKWMALICFGIALAAFVPGWRKHRRLLPAAVGVVGLTLICGAAFGFEGECCPSCQNETSVAAAAGSDDAACCEEACCAECEEEQRLSNEAEGLIDDRAATASFGPSLVDDTKETSWWLSLIPWLTPMGGLVLVTAHLLNRHFGCRCGCCPLAK